MKNFNPARIVIFVIAIMLCAFTLKGMAHMADNNKVNVKGSTIDVSRVQSVTPNITAEGKAASYTLQFDSVHDDTDANGRSLQPGEVGDHLKDQRMPKDARAIVGNRASYAESDLTASGFFDVYNRLHPNAKVGPKAKGGGKESAPPPPAE